MKNRNDAEYWREREREAERNAKGARLTLKLFDEYSKSAERIKNDIASFYGKYAGKYGLTYENAVKLLNRRELQEWRGELSEYVKRIRLETDEEVKKKLTAQLDALSANSSITRLSALIGQINHELNELYARAVDELRTEFAASFEEEYYKRSYDLQCRAGYFNELAKIDTGSVERAVSYPWSGADFSDRLWRSKEALIFNMREVLTQGLIQGKSVASMSKELSDKLGQSYKSSERVVRTESAYIAGQADIEAYKAAGVEWYEFMATEDERTSEICRSLDGKKFRISEAKAGVNYPPMHPNCRSTTIEYVPDEERAAHSKAAPDVTYENWLEKYVKHALTAADDDGRIKEEFTRFESGDKANRFFYCDDYEKWRANLSADAQEILRSYAAIGYENINTFLRMDAGKKNIDIDTVKNQVKLIDDAISSFVLKKSIVVQRGAERNALDILYLNNDFEELSELIGKKYTDNAFMSATALYGNPVATTKPVVFDIEIPHGTGRGAYINQFAGQYQDAEYEFLLKRDAIFTITNIFKDAELDKTYVKMVMDDVEGNKNV